MPSPTPLFPDVNANGIVDRFGNGGIANSRATFFSTPASLASTPQSPWYIAQWAQPVYLNPADYTQNNPGTHDPLYGNALYAWSEPGTNEAYAIYQNTQAAGGGYVYNLTDANARNEGDIFLSTPAALNTANNTLNHPVTLSLDAKITQALFQNTLLKAQAQGAVAGNIDLGFSLRYNGAGGLPIFTGYTQIVPMTSFLLNQYKSNAAYKVFFTTPAFANPAPPGTQFTYGNLLSGDPSLQMIPSDANAAPDLLTYNVNNYAYGAIYDAFKNYPAAEQANLFNLANWSIGGAYIGLASNNQQGASGVAGNVKLSLQLSNINLTTDLTQTYNQAQPVAPVTGGDPNPQITFYDESWGIGGKADGAAYTSLPGIQDKYIYNGTDNLVLTAPAGANWLFGGGSGTDVLSAISGNDMFQASTGSSFMNGGAGNDMFLIPDANVTGAETWDTITNFHLGDKISLAGLGGSGWTYSWHQNWGVGGDRGLTLYAVSNTTAGLAELVTFKGLQLSDLSTFSQAPNGGSLVFTRVPAPVNGSQVVANLSSESTVIQPEDLYKGTDQMQFIAPQGHGWLAGISTGLNSITASTGNDTYRAGVGNSFMLGGGGSDSFLIPDANLTGASAWDTIANFHLADVVTLAGLGGPGWTYSWLAGSGNPGGGGGLTLDAHSTITPGLTERVTFAGMTSGSLIFGVGPNNALTISHS